MAGSSSVITIGELTRALLPLGARAFGDERTTLSGIFEDSRRVTTGALFVARSGGQADGRAFVEAAKLAGAAAVLCEAGSGVALEPRIEVDDLAMAFGQAAQLLSGRPSERLRVVGITGTNGKTTTASLIDQALRTLGVKTARLGTLGFFIGDEQIFDTLTTPQADRLAEAMTLALDRGVDVLVMEVSSHALAQDRVAGVRFDVAAFTNLTQDHLDYHGSLDAYGSAKARLFLDYAPRRSVLVVDGPFGASLAQRVDAAFTVSGRADASADIVTRSLRVDADGIEAELVIRGEVHRLASRLIGLHNLENLLLAQGVLMALDVTPTAALFALAQATSVPGRLERCDELDDDLLALVDYAHTPDALSRVLAALRQVTHQPIVCIFGCGGDRDRTKRAPMARAVAEIADVIWLTSDNPRFEDPQVILSDARAGFAGSDRDVHEEPDRARAIERAILAAPERAVVLVAGKGHETYQLVRGERFDFDDRVRTKLALAQRRKERAARGL